MQNLQSVLSEHKRLKVPTPPQNDRLAEWLAELMQIDSYYVGLLASSIDGKISERVDFSHIEKLEEAFRKFQKQSPDCLSYWQCVDYLASLQKVCAHLGRNPRSISGH